MRPITDRYSFKKYTKQDSLIFNFFLAFGEAISAGNIENIKKCWAFPSYILGDLTVNTINTSEDLEKFFSTTKKDYTIRGIKEARPEIIRTQWLTDQIAVVLVRWPFVNKNGNEFGEESSYYTLKLDKNAKLKIHMLTLLGEKLSEITSAH